MHAPVSACGLVFVCMGGDVCSTVRLRYGTAVFSVDLSTKHVDQPSATTTRQS